MERKQRRLLMVLAMALVVGMATSAANAQLVAYWKLDESSGTIAYDSAGTSHGFFCGYPLWEPTGGVHKGAVYFHGGIEKIVAPLNCEYVQPGAYYDPEIYDDHLDTGVGPFTIACWFKLDGGWTVPYQYVLAKNYSFRLYRNNVSSTIRWRTNYGGNRNSTTAVDDGNWWFVAGMYDGTSRHRFFLAQTVGELHSPEREWFDEGALYPNGTAWAWAIGGISYTGYSYHERGIVGWVDDVSYWGLELKQGQLEELFLYGADRVNIPPVVDAGPPQIGHLKGIFDPAVFQLGGEVADQTVFGPNELTHKWVQTAGPPLHKAPTHPNGFDPNEFVLKPKVFMNIAQYYTLVLSASDGVYEANDYVKFDVRPIGWSGEIIKYTFDGDLLDSAADNEILDHLKALRHLGINELTQKPEYYQVVPDYAPGIIGQAVHLKDVSLPGTIDPILEQPQPSITGTMLQCKHDNIEDNFELALHGFGTWTCDMYIRPDPDMDVLGRIIYMYNVDYDDGWNTDNLADDGNSNVWYTVCDIGPYQFGSMTYQSNLYQVYQRYGYENNGYEVLTPPEEWHHVAVTGDAYNITVWVNGYPAWISPYDGSLMSSLLNEDGLRISSNFYNRSYEGMIDDLRINMLPMDAAYMKSRVMLIPIELITPVQDFEYVDPDNCVLKWRAGKGPYNYQYQVWLRDDSVPSWTKIGTTSDTSFAVLNTYLTTGGNYGWRIQPIVDGGLNEDAYSEIWDFSTFPIGFEPMIARWKFDEGAGTIINDSATGKNRQGEDWNYFGKIAGSGDPDFVKGWIAADRQFAGHFSGEMDDLGNQLNYVRIPEPCGMDYPESDPCIFADLPLDKYTLSLWMKTDIGGFQNTDETMLSLGDSYSIQRFRNTNYALYMAGEAGKPGGDYEYNYSGKNNTPIDDPTNVNDGNWHHLAAVYDNNNDLVILYVDGQLEASVDFDSADYADRHTLEGGKEKELWLAGNYRYKTQGFNGSLDDVRVYHHKALSAADVLALYNAGYSHKRPVVEAGDYQILEGPPTYNTTVTGSVVNDGLPPGNAATTIWTVEEKPIGSVVNITAPTALSTNVSFDLAGIYTLRLTCLDDTFDAYDEVKVWCQSAAGMGSEILYLRFEADIDPNPLVLKVANEFINGQPFINIPPIGKESDPDSVAQIDPNVPEILDDTGQDVNPLPLTDAANTGSLGAGMKTPRMKGGVYFYPELTYPEDITVEFFAEIGYEILSGDNDYTILDCRSELADVKGALGGFAFYKPDTLRLQYRVDDELLIGRHDTITLQTNITLADYEIYRFNLPNLPVHVGWKHIAWIYDHKTGISRIFENGKQAIITQVNGEFVVPEYYYDGPDNKRLLMPPVNDSLVGPGEDPINQLIFADAGLKVAESGHNIDEVRIHAKAILPSELLIIAENHCVGALKGDFNGDCQEDLLDYAVLAGNWMRNTDPYK